MTVFLATIRDKYELDFGSEFNLARWHDFCNNNIGKLVRIDKPNKSRTMPQNRYYWFYLRLVAQDTGNTEEDLHAFFRQKLLPKRYIKIVGKKGTYEVEDYKSTTKLTKAEFSEYLDRICAMTGVPLPDPIIAGFFY